MGNWPNYCRRWRKIKTILKKMYIAMNRFKIVLGKEEEFEKVWKNRDTHLEGVKGFKNFNLIKETPMKNIRYILHTVLGTPKKIL